MGGWWCCRMPSIPMLMARKPCRQPCPPFLLGQLVKVSLGFLTASAPRDGGHTLPANITLFLRPCEGEYEKFAFAGREFLIGSDERGVFYDVLYHRIEPGGHALFRAAKGGKFNPFALWRVFVVDRAVLVFAFIAAVLHDVSLRPGRLFHAASA